MEITDTFVLDTSLTVSHVITKISEWDNNKLQNLVNISYRQLILAAPIQFNSIPHSICWGLSCSGEFSIKLAT